MVWGGLVLAYCMYQVQSPLNQENAPLALSFTAFSIVFTILHIHLKIPVVHFVTYGAIVILIATLDTWIMWSQYCKKLIYFYAVGFILQLMGVLFWCADNLFCDRLEATRGDVARHLPSTKLAI